MKITLDENAIMPTRAHDTDAGLDLYSRENEPTREHDKSFYNMTCPICGKKFHLRKSDINSNGKNYCSRECYGKARSVFFRGENNHQYGKRGRKNASWKHDRKIASDGYVMIRCTDHPFRQKDDYIMEHRIVAEKHLLTKETSVEVDGKLYLSPDYVVHHKNGDKTDNRPENLQIMTKKDHVSMHKKEKPTERDPFTHKFLVKKVKVQIDDGGFLPERAHSTDAGYDIKSPVLFTVPAHGSYFVGTKVHMNIPNGYVGFLKSKSGLNCKHGIVCEGVVDAHYTGEIKCKFYNNSDEDYSFQVGDKMVQIVLLPILRPKLIIVDKLEETERGDQGFGSSGK